MLQDLCMSSVFLTYQAWSWLAINFDNSVHTQNKQMNDYAARPGGSVLDSLDMSLFNMAYLITTWQRNRKKYILFYVIR